MSKDIEDIADIAAFEQEAAFEDAAANPPETVPGTGDDQDLDLEAPEADVAEQRAEALPPGDDTAADVPPAEESELEADPADVADQRRVVGVDDEDHR